MSQGDSGFGSGIFNALNTHRQKAQELAKKLENLPVTYKQFNSEQLRNLLEVKKNLEIYKENNSKSVEILNKVIFYLDSLNIWKSKFTTGGGGVNRDNDSVYYITKDNISLRLKRSELSKGMKHVIQPFMENIIFLESYKEGQFYPSEQPVLNSIPSEYSSEEFYSLQKQNDIIEDFKSKIPHFYKEGKLFFVGKPRNLHHDHPGSEVEEILFSKP